ncbi:MAG: DUF2914 domain-containing protein [Ignavibacteriales bacterium]|nr:DUF2914 domain-containing protein [Ignavibacteriales bacterium]
MKQIFAIGILLMVAGLVFSSNTIAQQETTKSDGIQIIDAKLGKDVKDRELLDEAATFDLKSKVFLWLKVTGATDQALTVIWKHGDMVHATELSIGGSPWRTWASKTAYTAGDWLVTVTDQSGKVLKELNFKVQ